MDYRIQKRAKRAIAEARELIRRHRVIAADYQRVMQRATSLVIDPESSEASLGSNGITRAQQEGLGRRRKPSPLG